jgi:AcrR family transcriptional regulator
MKEKILINAVDLFLTYGFKSITMDDLANKLGISKKTIYKHFKNKTKLVEASALLVFSQISKGIDCICELEKNPIEEIYDIKQFVMKHLKNEKSSPQYQLQKYYPKIYNTLKQKQFEIMHGCVKENLERGIKQELYRKTINVEYITRQYFNSILNLKDKDLYPENLLPMKALMENFLEYHLRGIVTQKGLKKLIEIIETKNENE